MVTEIRTLQSKAVEAERLRIKLAQAEAEKEKLKFAARLLAQQERAKLSNRLLTNYCWIERLPNGRTYVKWPTRDRLAAITTVVENYLKFSGVL